MRRTIAPLSLLVLAACTTPTAAPLDDGVYAPGRVMVRLRPGADLAGLEPLAGTDWRVARGELGHLRSDPRVEVAWPVGLTHGAGTRGRKGAAGTSQWHLEAAGVPVRGDLADWTVAILDTGVAYEDGPGHVRAASLASSPIVAPWDFVNDDPDAWDDHQHGTLMASLIASDGEVRGVAPGVGLMPVKVLGADNTGDEIALVAGLHHAIDEGADVINLSLAFAPGYVPSPPLLEALERAWEEGVVLVAASGNQGAEALSWPAASPLVVAVGASGRAHALAPYSNRHPGVDLLAPGGDLSTDLDHDGVGDGLISEGIAPGDPTETGLWLSAGTSQAAALTSGAAIHLLDAGASADEVVRALQRGASNRGASYALGEGAGFLDVTSATRRADDPMVLDAGGLHAAVLPWLVPTSAGVRPAARITVVDDDGHPISHGEALVSFAGTSNGTASCRPVDGTCTVLGPEAADDGQGAWVVSLDALVHARVARRPHGALFATDALEILLAAIEAHPYLQDALLAFAWEDGEDPVLGPVADAFTVVDSGTGLAASPLGVVLQRGRLGGATIEELLLDLDGTGLAASPLGILHLQYLTLEGGGLAASPLGLRRPSFAVMQGNGLAASPLGLRAVSIYSGLGGGYDSPRLSFRSDPVLLGHGLSPTVDLAGTAIGAHLARGGFTLDGYPAATLLVGAGTIDLATAGSAVHGAGSEPLPEGR